MEQIKPCPNCGSLQYARERTPNGRTTCLSCHFQALSKDWGFCEPQSPEKLTMSHTAEASCDGCNGMCCRCFSLRYSPKELEEALKRNSHITPNDFAFAVENFIFIGEASTNPFYKTTETNGRYFYSCRKLGWDGKCTDYDNRPNVCRGFMVEYGGVYVDCLLQSVWKEKQKCQHGTNELELSELKLKERCFTANQKSELSCSESELPSCSQPKVAVAPCQITADICWKGPTKTT